MPSIVTSDFRVSNALSFITSLSISSSILYSVIGRATPWEPLDSVPPIPNYTPTDVEMFWRDAIAARRVVSSDVSLAIPRINWESGEVYEPYTMGIDIEDSRFYVVTSDYRVYKCVSNFRGTPSVFRPTGTSTEVITMPDGYRWKYMYSVSPGEAIRFLTVDYVPIAADFNVAASAVDGTIDHITMIEGGVGYSTAPTVTIVSSTGTGCEAVAIMEGGTVVGIDVSAAGSGYRSADVVITGDGTGATARAEISPVGGHGSNAASELGAYYVVVSNLYDEALTNFPTVNDYRRIFYVRNPWLNGTSIPADGLTYNLTQGVRASLIAGNETLADDEVFIGDTSGAEVVVIESLLTGQVGERIFNVTRLNNIDVIDGEVLVAQSSGSTWSVANAEERLPGLEERSGQITFIENRRPVTRAPDQAENIITVYEF